MKKFYYLLAGIAIVLVTIIACEDASIEVNEMQTLQKDEVLLQKNAKPDKEKVDVCHYDADLDVYVLISISQNGWDNGHIYHEKDVELIDADGDGYVAAENECVPGGDCDDTNPDINPGAIEICDGIDNNCDGQIDEGVKTTFYEDLDGDTFGNPAVSTEACEAPDGYVLDNTDCDDTKFPYSPKGTYIFKYLNKDEFIHYYEITKFDPITRKFEGTGWNINPNTEIITGMVDATGKLTGNILYDNDYTLDISGTVGECGGIISLDDFVKY